MVFSALPAFYIFIFPFERYFEMILSPAICTIYFIFNVLKRSDFVTYSRLTAGR